MDTSKIDLNKPAFGPDSQKVAELETKTEQEPVETPSEEEVKEPEVQVAEQEEENKVPYSRFKKFHERALEAEKEAAEWRAKVAELENERLTARNQDDEPTSLTDGDMPSYWREMYGDSEASKKAWSIEQRRQQEILERAERRAAERAVEAVREQQEAEEYRLSENLQTIDQQLENVSALVGRDLTEKEQSAILDIVDEYTPKDDNGNYAGQILPLEKAWEIYELKSQAGKSANQKSRDSVAALSSSRTEGNTNVGPDKDKDFNPLDWMAYKKRL